MQPGDIEGPDGNFFTTIKLESEIYTNDHYDYLFNNPRSNHPETDDDIEQEEGQLPSEVKTRKKKRGKVFDSTYYKLMPPPKIIAGEEKLFEAAKEHSKKDIYVEKDESICSDI